jgi:hypothetical protein
MTRKKMTREEISSVKIMARTDEVFLVDGNEKVFDLMVRLLVDKRTSTERMLHFHTKETITLQIINDDNS